MFIFIYQRVLKQAAFTLIELMIVMVIIGILAAVGVPIYVKYVKNARASEVNTILGAVIEYCQSYNRSRSIENVGVPWPVDASTIDTIAQGSREQAAWIDEVVGGDVLYFVYKFDNDAGTGGEALVEAEGGDGRTDDAGTVLSSEFSATDVLQYDFGNVSERWKSQNAMRSIQPTNPNGATNAPTTDL